MDVRDILEEAGFSIHSESNGFYRMMPIHRDSNNPTALSVNKTTGFFHDFATGERGSLARLIKISTGENIKFESAPAPVNFKKELPFNPAGCVTTLFPSYTFYNKKGISTETLKLFESGFCQGGKMYARYTFPIINPDNSLMGYAGRAIAPHPKKWKNIGPTSKWLYPLKWSKEHILKHREVIIVESIGNMLALWECGYKHVIVCFGTAMSKTIISSLISLNPDRILLAMDNDDNELNPGASAAARHRKELEKWFDNLKICDKLSPLGVDLSSLYEQQGKQSIDAWYQI
jgi:hypothetical protein